MFRRKYSAGWRCFDPLTGLYNRRFAEQRERLSNSTRGSDVWGGDEFIPLLVDCEMEELSRVLLRLEGFQVPVNGKTLPVSVAAGWKADEPGDRVEELIEAADRRRYHKEIVKKREPTGGVAEVQ